MNSMGVCGPSNVNAIAARRRAGAASRSSRRPSSVFATWSWFCVNHDHRPGAGSIRAWRFRAAFPATHSTAPGRRNPCLAAANELLGIAEIIVGSIHLVLPGERHPHAVMKIVVPHSIQPVSARRLRSRHATSCGSFSATRMMRRPARGGTRGGRDLGQHMRARGVVNALRCVEAQAVQMILGDPVGRVPNEMRSHRTRIGTVEVQRGAPVVRIAIRKVGRAESWEIVAVGADVVVHHVENDGHACRMRRVDETPQRIARPRNRETARTD